jgi:hypothetical protein
MSRGGEYFELRRQSDSGDGAFGRTKCLEITARLVRAKAVSRCACHRSPKLSSRDSPGLRRLEPVEAAAAGRREVDFILQVGEVQHRRVRHVCPIRHGQIQVMLQHKID